MPRYIDADKLYSRVKTHTNPYGKPTIDYDSGVKVLKMIETEPTADVVEVVRCKDCDNRVEFDSNKFHCELTGYYCGETGYCSDAVRKQKKGGEG